MTYREPQGEDDGEWLGPPALDVDPDGGVWVDDLYANRLLRYEADGTRGEPLDLERHDVLAAMDIAVGADVVHVLDVYPRLGRYRVLRLTHDGRALSTHDLPEGYHLEDGLSGIDLDGDGSLLLEVAGGSRLVQLLDPAGQLRLAERDGYTAHGRRYEVRFSGQPFAPVTVVAAGVRVEVRADHGTGGVQFLGATRDGDFFLSVDDVHFGERIHVDQTVRRYSAAGRFISAARRELPQFTYVPHPFALGPDGRVYELTTGADSVAVEPMRFSATLDPVLPPSPVTRWTATDAVDAALVFSRAAFPSGAETALLARDDLFADALATGGTQQHLAAPLLLTPGDRLDPDVARELTRLGVRTVHILGGSGAVSDAVERALKDAGLATTRLAGRDRVQTAAAVAGSTFPRASDAILVRGFASGPDATAAFADALAVAAWAADRQWPTLLTRTDRLPPVVADYLRAAGTDRVYVVGGRGAVGDPVVAELKRMGVEVVRVAGPDRAGTAVQIARQRGAAAADEVLLVDGYRPDAWAAGIAGATYAAGRDATVVLGAPRGLPRATAEWLSGVSQQPPLLCAPLTTEATCQQAAAAAGHSPS